MPIRLVPRGFAPASGTWGRPVPAPRGPNCLVPPAAASRSGSAFMPAGGALPNVLPHAARLRRAGRGVKPAHDSCNSVLPGVPLAGPTSSASRAAGQSLMCQRGRWQHFDAGQTFRSRVPEPRGRPLALRLAVGKLPSLADRNLCPTTRGGNTVPTPHRGRACPASRWWGRAAGRRPAHWRRL